MTKQDIIERAKRVSFSSNPKDYIDFVGELAKENETVPADVQEASRNYADKRLLENKRELAESGHTRHFKMGYVCFAGYEIEEAFADGAEWQAVKDGECHEESFEDGAKWERERLMKDAREHLPKGCETLADTVGFAEGVKLGRRLERQDLIGDAVECNVIWYDGRLLDFTQEQLDAALDKIGAGVDAKVSVIIIKKENYTMKNKPDKRGYEEWKKSVLQRG